MDEVDRLLADMAVWLGEERVDHAAESRARGRWLRQQKLEEARFAGVALDFAERGIGVSLQTIGGRSHHGTIAAVGQDFVVVRAAERVTLVALPAVASLRAAPGPGRVSPIGDAMSDRAEAVSVSLAGILAGLAGDRPHVQIVAGGAGPYAGELRAVGEDVVTLRLAGEPPTTIYVRLGSVTECSVFGSG